MKIGDLVRFNNKQQYMGQQFIVVAKSNWHGQINGVVVEQIQCVSVQTGKRTPWCYSNRLSVYA